MGFDQQGNTKFTVSKNAQGKWDVCEQGFPKALASFDAEQDAQKYATGLANVKDGEAPKMGAGAARK